MKRLSLISLLGVVYVFVFSLTLASPYSVIMYRPCHLIFMLAGILMIVEGETGELLNSKTE